MSIQSAPNVFRQLCSKDCIGPADLVSTRDGFWTVSKSLCEILAKKDVLDFPSGEGARLSCDQFFDDWFLYAVPAGSDYVYSLVKLREQEHDAENGVFADGDIPGVTISFVPFSCQVLLDCLAEPTDENRLSLDREIDRVVARRGQRHHAELKRYFINPDSEGAYLVADRYAAQIASFAEGGAIQVPMHYGDMARSGRGDLPTLVESLNEGAGRVVCDHEKIFFLDVAVLTDHERTAILATHTGNPSKYSFAAEVEYHARFLTALARIRLPFCRKSLYDSAVRADMTIGDAVRRRRASYYREGSKIVKRQYRLHKTGEDKR